MSEEAPQAVKIPTLSPTGSPPEPAPPAPNPIETIVNAWVSAHIHNSPLSRNSEAWNAFHAALPVLIDSLSVLNP